MVDDVVIHTVRARKQALSSVEWRLMERKCDATPYVDSTSVQSSRISGVNGSKLAAARLTKYVVCKR